MPKNKIHPWVMLREHQHCIVALKAIPENGRWRIYVVWDWEISVSKGIFSAYKSRNLHDVLDTKSILEACDIGHELSAEEAKIIFPELA